jgi:hypothetical protein
MHDGDIDYSKYTLLELEEALAGINRHQYPRNYANLRSAYEQLTANPVAPEPSFTTTSVTTEQTPSTSVWDRFWDSRPIAALGGALCLWWAYDLFNQESCPVGRRLMGAIVNAICDNFGHLAASGIPFTLGLISLVYAAFPRQRGGA